MGKHFVYPEEMEAIVREASAMGRTGREIAQVCSEQFGLPLTAGRIHEYRRRHGIPFVPCGTFSPALIDRARELLSVCTVKEAWSILKDEYGYTGSFQALRSGLKYHGVRAKDNGRFKPGVAPPPHRVSPKSLEALARLHHMPPANTRPVGSQRVGPDGYVWVKVDDARGATRRNWRPLHVVNWEQVHGPVPPGHRVMFLDGNSQNCAVENLTLVSAEIAAVQSRWGTVSSDPEVTRASLKLSELRCKLSELRGTKRRKKKEVTA